MKSADKVIVGEYYAPHLAHVSMEPPVAVADVKDGKAEIWAPVQSPGGTREDVAKTLGIPEDNVTVNVTLLGGGFGRKSKCDFALEAALLSKELGAPVKVQWTREDDVRHDFLHTVSVERIEAGLDKSGKVIAWRHRSAAPSIGSTFGAGAVNQLGLELAMGFVDMPFEIANVQCENPEAAAHTRIGWFRSVSNIPRAFAVQSMVGELAHATGRDQKDMLLELIGSPRILKLDSVKDYWNNGEPYDSYPIDTARLRRVVELVAEKGEWGRKVPKGHGLGIAVHRSFVSYIATIVEVAVDDKGKLTVPRVDTAIDCGTYINPERIQSQIEGTAIMGLSLAKYGEISFKDGKVQAEELRRLPGGPDGRSTADHPRPHRAARRRHAAKRRRRARRAAVCTGADERDFRRHRQAHPGLADRQAVGDLNVRGSPQRHLATAKRMRRTSCPPHSCFRQ